MACSRVNFTLLFIYKKRTVKYVHALKQKLETKKKKTEGQREKKAVTVVSGSSTSN